MNPQTPRERGLMYIVSVSESEGLSWMLFEDIESAVREARSEGVIVYIAEITGEADAEVVSSLKNVRPFVPDKPKKAKKK